MCLVGSPSVLAQSTKTAPETSAKNTVDDVSAIQGEYLGDIVSGATKMKIGIRVFALGDDKFRSIAYVGGLPGDGWTGNRKYESEATRAEDGTLFFDSSRSKIRWDGGPLKVNMRGQNYLFKRIERRSPTLGKKPPRNALVLFDGSSADAWSDGALDGKLLKVGGRSKQKFSDHKIHLEFQVPLEPDKHGQERGNSGVLVQGKYEIQILDSFGLKSQHNECGGILSVKKPDANVSLPPLAWQTLDVDFKAAKYEKGEVVDPPLMTVRHNGVTIHKNVELTSESPAALSSASPEPGPIYLEDRGSKVRFRNVWVLSSDQGDASKLGRR